MRTVRARPRAGVVWELRGRVAAASAAPPPPPPVTPRAGLPPHLRSPRRPAPPAPRAASSLPAGLRLASLDSSKLSTPRTSSLSPLGLPTVKLRPSRRLEASDPERSPYVHPPPQRWLCAVLLGRVSVFAAFYAVCIGVLSSSQLGETLGRGGGGRGAKAPAVGWRNQKARGREWNDEVRIRDRTRKLRGHHDRQLPLPLGGGWRQTETAWESRRRVPGPDQSVPGLIRGLGRITESL